MRLRHPGVQRDNPGVESETGQCQQESQRFNAWRKRGVAKNLKIQTAAGVMQQRKRQDQTQRAEAAG
jgi:hypothetical protein